MQFDFSSIETVMAHLRQGMNGNADLPLVCLLDIKMPGVSGLEVLEWIRNEPYLDRLPVAMITSSNHPDDLEAARRLGAQCYLLKFPKPEDMREVIAAAEGYGFQPYSRARFDVLCNQFVAMPRDDKT